MPEPTDTAVSELLRERLRLDAELARRQQAVTILFVDIVGSTRFYDQHGDVAGLAMVQKFLDKLTPIVEEHEGVVVKTIGDAILARYHTAIEGVRCGLAMQFALLEYNVGRAPMDQIHIRVALNSGYALIKEQDVFGDVVNVCSRIESAAKPDDILISPSVYDQICQFEEVAVRKRAEGVQLKGKAEKLDLYEVVWALDEAVGPAPPRPSQAQVVMSALPHTTPAAEAVAPAIVPSIERTGSRSWVQAKLSRSIIRAVLVAAVSAIIAAGILFFLSNRKVTALAERDTIVVADFVNNTGDPVFDDTLKLALAADLGQSPFLNILSERKIAATMRLMGRSPDLPVMGDVAQELCQRVGSKALLAGSISQLGNTYVIGLNATNCATGDSLAKQQVQAVGKEEVLKALGTAATNVRATLGESLASVQKFATPIDEATTSSLEALKSYSTGRRAALTKGDAAALPYHQRAIEIDPNFAVAYGALAAVYNNLGQASLAKQNAAKAYELRERASEREKYGISAFYYEFATGETEKAIRSYALWMQSYPRDSVPAINLGNCYMLMGQWEQALEASQHALQLEPNSTPLNANLAWTQIALNRTDEAQATLKQALARKLDAFYLRIAVYDAAFIRRDLTTMQEQVAWSMGRAAEEDWLLATQADTDAYFGHLRKAREYSERAVESAHRAGAEETAALWRASAALREAEFGNTAFARQQAHAALQQFTGRDVQALAGLALARAGDVNAADKIVESLNVEFPANTVIQRYWLPSIRAAIEINYRKGAAAVETLKPAVPLELGQSQPLALGLMYPVYLRGQAYLLSQQPMAAAAEFSKIIDHPGIVLNSPLSPLSQLGLAQSYLDAGEPARARTAYEQFVALWKAADPDIPILKQAKSQYGKLR